MSAPAPSDAPAATKPLASHKRPAEAPADGDADAAARAVPFADASPALQPSDVHVLLADDEKISRLVTSKLLRQSGYQVTAVESGRALLLKLAESPSAFSLILTDVAMPDVNGLEVLRYVRSQAALHALPVIMMSAHENAGTVFECIQRGAEDYLLKPVTQKEMKQLWQHVWRRRHSWQRVPALAAAAPDDTLLPGRGRAATANAPPAATAAATAAPTSSPAPAAATGSAGPEEGEAPGEMYTASEMREHCQRQIARYTKVLQVIDSHPHLFPTAEALQAAGAGWPPN